MGKTPGTNGFGAELKKNFFLKQMGDFVIRALIKSLRDGELSATQKQGIITRIPKGDKDKNLIKKNGDPFLF